MRESERISDVIRNPLQYSITLSLGEVSDRSRLIYSPYFGLLAKSEIVGIIRRFLIRYPFIEFRD